MVTAPTARMDGQVAQPRESSELVESLIELQGLLLTTDSVDGLLRDVATLTARGVGGDVSCGITMQVEERPATVASSSALASQLDEVQYGQNDGPCLQALRTGEEVTVPDFVEETRWGDYPLVAQTYGCRSCLAVPIFVDSRPVLGVLNLYAPEPRAFGPRERTAARTFSAQAAVAVAATIRFAEQVELSEQLRTALSSRAIIDQAIGIVMAQRRCSAQDAFEILRRASQNRNVKLRVVAADLTASVAGVRPQPRSAAG